MTELFKIAVPPVPPIPSKLPSYTVHSQSSSNNSNNSYFSDLFFYPPPSIPFPSLSSVLLDYISSSTDPFRVYLSSSFLSSDSSSQQPGVAVKDSSPLPPFHFLCPPLLMNLFPKMEPPEELCEESFKKRVFIITYLFYSLCCF
jgi:hypothetical protein